jgi:ATP-dependent DNA ligase
MKLYSNFFPMRPTATGKAPTVSLLKTLRDKFVVTPKLNGDRAILWVLADEVYIHNRHGSAYTFMVRNRASFAQLPVGTVLDGEVFNRNFYPFECLAYGDADYTKQPAWKRLKLAEKLCQLLGIDWLFAEPTDEWIGNGAANGTQWEGVVLRLRNSIYRPCGKPFQESSEWFKLKWA